MIILCINKLQIKFLNQLRILKIELFIELKIKDSIGVMGL